MIQMKLDLKSMTRPLRERLQTEANPVLRRNIATVIRHIEGEIANNVDLTMSTMVPEPVIRSFFSSLVGRFEPPPAGQSSASRKHESYMAIEGGAAVRAMYDMVCDRRLVWTHFDVDTLVVDTAFIVQAGLFHCPTTGAGLKQLGRTVDDENALYLGIGRMLVIFPFDVKSGLLLGEDIYVDPSTFDGAETRKIGPDDYLPGYDKVVDLPPR
jgi:hypothetical protein